MKRIVGMICLVFTQAALACPMCKDSANHTGGVIGGSTPGGDGGSYGNGFNASVYLFLSMLFVSFGLVAFQLVRGVRSSRTYRSTNPALR